MQNKKAEDTKMCKMYFLKGMGVGLVVGACVGMCIAPDKRKGKKMATKALRTLSDLVDEFSEAMGI